jgi:hypothetical protein
MNKNKKPRSVLIKVILLILPKKRQWLKKNMYRQHDLRLR